MTRTNTTLKYSLNSTNDPFTGQQVFRGSNNYNEIESSLSSREVLNIKKPTKPESMECQQIYSKDSLSSIYYILSSLGATMYGNTRQKNFKNAALFMIVIFFHLK